MGSTRRSEAHALFRPIVVGNKFRIFVVAVLNRDVVAEQKKRREETNNQEEERELPICKQDEKSGGIRVKGTLGPRAIG